MATKPRNFAAQSPLLGKGGVHEKTKSAKRQKAKKELRRELNNWMGRGGRRPHGDATRHQHHVPH